MKVIDVIVKSVNQYYNSFPIRHQVRKQSENRDKKLEVFSTKHKVENTLLCC